MKKFLFLSVFGLFLFPSFVFAQDLVEGEQTFYRAEVIEILDLGEHEGFDGAERFQQIRVKILEGDENGNEIEVELNLGQVDEVNLGEKVVVTKIVNTDTTSYFVSERYRLPMLWYVFGFFIFLVLIFVKWKGIMSLFGVVVSLGVLIWYIAPQILSGKDPIVVSLIGSIIIAVTSLYLAHGFKQRTSVALLSMLITVVFSIILSYFFVKIVHLFGVGSEEVFFLELPNGMDVNFKGLLLGGMIIGTLGILDDVAMAQAATVDEIHKTNPHLPVSELYKRGMSVGSEHITSMINTLVLAYAGASFPMFLLFTVTDQPIWTILNSEFMSEEIVRTLVGSSSLVFAVPVTTILMAKFLTRSKRL